MDGTLSYFLMDEFLTRIKPLKRPLIFLLTLSLFISCERERTITDPEINEPTTIEGNLSGILPRENSPYIVTGNITVDSLAELLIEPGVELFFKHGTYLSVYGILRASGTSSQPIFF